MFFNITIVGVNNRLPVLNIYRMFVYHNNTEEHINEFVIEYMVNITFYVDKSFKEQVEKRMNDMFDTTTQPFIKML